MFDAFILLDCATITAGSYDVVPFCLHYFPPLCLRSTIRLTGEVFRHVFSAFPSAVTHAFPPDITCRQPFLRPFDGDGFLRLHDVEPLRFRLRLRMLDLLLNKSSNMMSFFFHFPRPAGKSRVG